MYPSTMPSAVAQAMRACGRTLPAAKSLTVAGPSNASRVFARTTFLIAPSYKARIAVRGYATATATATEKKATRAPSQNRIAPADSKRKAAKSKATSKAKTKAKPKAKAKAKAKTKAPKKKKAIVKKAKKPGPVKRELTPEKKAVLVKRELKKTALLHKEPKKETITVWTTYVAERVKTEKVDGPGKDFGDLMRRLSADFKNISDSEKARIEQKIVQNKANNAANYKKWVESHTVEEIYKANLARVRLVRDHNVKTRKITDDRMPKRPTTSFAYFVKARMSNASGGQTVAVAIKDISNSWKSLSAADKKPYDDLMAADKSRYAKEMGATSLPAPQIA